MATTLRVRCGRLRLFCPSTHTLALLAHTLRLAFDPVIAWDIGQLSILANRAPEKSETAAKEH